MSKLTEQHVPRVCQTIADIEWLLSHEEIALGHTPSVWRQIVESLKALVEEVEPGALAVHRMGANGPASDVFAQPPLLEDEGGQG